MNCFKLKRSKNSAKTPSQTEEKQEIPEHRIIKHDALLKIKECKVYLMDENDALELANVNFEVLRVSDSNISLATTTKVGDELQWPLTKEEPVVKLDALHYLFSLPIKDGNSLSYGVTFSQKQHGDLSFLYAFLKENSLCTSAASSSSSKEVVNWKKFAPAIDEYNSVLARAIAGGTGQIVKGIFICSNANSNQDLNDSGQGSTYWDCFSHHPLWVSQTEKVVMENRQEGWTKELEASGADIASLASSLKKPLRPLWISRKGENAPRVSVRPSKLVTESKSPPERPVDSDAKT